MSEPLVTIVTPSYNQEKFIRATIESVLAQDYPAIEYIVMDGGSTDETAAIAGEYSGKLTFISERDRGQSHAINKGFRMARGEIVSWLNSDDIILPGAVRHAVDVLTQNPRLGAVYGEGYTIDRDGSVIGRFGATEPFNLWKLIYLSDYILQQTVYFRRSVFDDVGFVDEQLNWGMDWELLMRIGKKYPMELIPEYMGSLREYDAAKTFSGGFRRIRELVKIMRRHGQVRFPPGMFTYGLDTLQRKLSNVVSEPILQRSINPVCSKIIGKILRDAQGLYADDWAGPRLRYMLPAGRGAVRICGSLPAEIPELSGQVIAVECRGTVVARQALSPGAFEIEFEDPIGDGAEPLSLEVRSSRSFVPSRCGMGPDFRRLSFRLTKIERCRRVIS
jgi:glycosyltransferase involved in cell wall biosynthesis